MTLTSDALVSVRDMTVQFGGLVAVNNVSFDVHEGEILGVIGPNGAGKTTSFNALTGSVRVKRGTVRLAGDDITNIHSDRICHRGIGRTFQLVRLFRSMTVKENVTVGALVKHHTVKQAQHAASEVIERLGIEHISDTPVSEVPLADQKRTEIARALATGPKVLLLDEMMNGLTGDETRKSVELVRNLNKDGLTVVIVEHVLPVIRELCGRALVFDAGAILAEGTPEECMSDPAVIEAYIGRRKEKPSKPKAADAASEEE
jgi:branched-chain amino acid transport system ATP-binding protein